MPKPTAEMRFIASLAEFDRYMARLAELRANHFNANPDGIVWGDVSSLFYVNARLDDALKHYGIYE